MTWRRVLATYGAAHVGMSLLWSGSDLLTLYLLVAVYRLDPLTAGLLFLIGLAVNALANFAVGNYPSRRPRHAPPLAAGALMLAGLTFPRTVLLAPYGSAALLAPTVAFRVAYAGVDVPHNALLGPAAAGGSDRLGMAVLLWAIVAGGVLIGATLVPLLAGVARPAATRGADRALPASRPASLPGPFLAASVIGIVALGALAKAVLHLPAG